MKKPISNIAKEMALSVLNNNVSNDGFSLVLQFVHLAWNLADEKEFKEEPAYIYGIKEFQGKLPSLQDEFIIKDVEKLVEKLMRYKLKHFPDDKRTIASCKNEDGKVKVKWF